MKHLLDNDTYFVWGKPIAELGSYTAVPMAIAAYTSQFKEHERVDTMFFTGTTTHYALSLPEGVYTLLIYADTNVDQIFGPNEVVGQKELKLGSAQYPEKLAKDINVELTLSHLIPWAETIQAPEAPVLESSVYYPAGAIRRLGDSIFDENIATMGMYDPASFIEVAPTMFYALEEDQAHKIPVVFVHGIGGSSRSFETIVERMDKDRYQPWFFYYPSGGDLDQLGDFFYNIFLSGEVVLKGDMPIIVVAHSMGGLIVRDALNRYDGDEDENNVGLFVSIASPFGGHPSAALGEEHGLIVLPAWRDLNPASEFINDLYKNPLPKRINHQLYYAYNNSSVIKMGENSDGVVPLSSQLNPMAQRQSQGQFGFNSDHVDILKNEEMIERLLIEMESVENPFPESHLSILKNGGIDVAMPDTYSPVTKQLIGYAGKYLVLLVKGGIEPISVEQERFIQAVRGDVAATSDLEINFKRFMQEYRQQVRLVLEEHEANQQ
ncbi:hypothetical protein L4D20_02455 [Vibrio kyushuensis]|uniref:esterase/lipase family protein n=1 Tax=Vibrio kyushuensis TaxID=2910249 RepID=UPI003D145D9F